MQRFDPETGGNGPSDKSPDEVRDLAARGFLFGLPLILTDLVRSAHSLPVGRFVRLPATPAAFASGLTAARDPNLIASSAWVNLDKAPVVLAVPDLHGRHMTIALHDAWGRCFAGVGSRATGGLGRDTAIVGPHWRGQLGPGVHAVRSPTTEAWITTDLWARGPGDRAATLDLERRVFLVPLDGEPVGPCPGERTRLDKLRNVHAKLDQMSAPDFFHRLAGLLAIHPAGRARSAEVEALAGLGVRPGQPFERRGWRPDLAAALQAGYAAARLQLEAASPTSEAGWITQGPPAEETISERAAHVWTSLGVPPRADVLTLTARSDAKGGRLSGAKAYTIRFRPGQTPPVEGAWTLDVLDLFGRPLDRIDHPLEWVDQSGMRWDDDGGLTLNLSPAQPGAAPLNWIETPSGDFALRIQLHWPNQSALDGRWRPPEITPVRSSSATGRSKRGAPRAGSQPPDHRAPDRGASMEGAFP